MQFPTWGCTFVCFSIGQVLSLSLSRSRPRSRFLSLSLSLSRSRSLSRFRCRLLWWDEDLTGLWSTSWSCWPSAATWQPCREKKVCKKNKRIQNHNRQIKRRKETGKQRAWVQQAGSVHQFQGRFAIFLYIYYRTKITNYDVYKLTIQFLKENRCNRTFMQLY